MIPIPFKGFNQNANAIIPPEEIAIVGSGQVVLIKDATGKWNELSPQEAQNILIVTDN